MTTPSTTPRREDGIVFDFTPYVNARSFAFLCAAVVVGASVGQMLEGTFIYTPATMAIAFVAASVVLCGTLIYMANIITAIASVEAPKA